MSSATTTPVAELAHAAKAIMDKRESALIRVCESCGSNQPRHDERVCPNCGQACAVLVLHISRIR